MSLMIETELVTRLSKDLRQATRELGRAEARYLVDAYYQMQRNRIRSGNQAVALTKSEEPHGILEWFEGQSEVLETQIRRALGWYAEGAVPGRWALSICGIGPVIAAGLLAHIEIEKAPTVGHIWRFAGLDPTVEWKTGTKRPWNASLKTLCWKLGESFVKVSGREEDVYGKLYLERKALEVERNAAGLFGEQATRALARKRYRAETVARAVYERGELPPGHLHARAKRWAVKLFLSHYHHVAYVDRFGSDPPKPYVLSVLGHGHEIPIPNYPMED